MTPDQLERYQRCKRAWYQVIHCTIQPVLAKRQLERVHDNNLAKHRKSQRWEMLWSFFLLLVLAGAVVLGIWLGRWLAANF